MCVCVCVSLRGEAAAVWEASLAWEARQPSQKIRLQVRDALSEVEWRERSLNALVGEFKFYVYAGGAFDAMTSSLKLCKPVYSLNFESG